MGDSSLHFKNFTTYDKHFKTEYFQALGATIQKEGLLAAPLNIMTVKPVAGFASR
jgi:quinol monooxygenase YgiN